MTGVGTGSATIRAEAGGLFGVARVSVARSPEHLALVALYEATDGPNWTDNDGWLTEAPIGEWSGVGVDGSGVVRDLQLTWRGLAGPLPPEIGYLTGLRTLALHHNKLSGPLPPEIGNLASLEHLLLDVNNVQGPLPPELGRLVRMRHLNISSNALTGAIPPELGNMAALDHLRLGNNDLTGPIPPELGSLTKLVELNLERNFVGGAIPPELGSLANLERLHLAYNQLTGSIPPELGDLGKLRHLALDVNALTGEVPPELGNLSRLEELWLETNDLSGPLPSQLGNLFRLRKLVVAKNRFAGPLPSSYLRMRALTDMWMAVNESLCMPGTARFAEWRGKLAATDPDPLYCNAADVAALTSLHEMTDGGGWTASDGWNDGHVLDTWHGVTADSLGRVTALALNRNGLSGTLPSTLGNLEAMTELRIGGNPALTGRLPLSLSRVDLRTLHYAGTGLCHPDDEAFTDWLGGIASHGGTGVACGARPDRDVLVALYGATGGDDWRHNDNWLSDLPLGEWHGVRTSDGSVTELNLSDNLLSGSIPPDIGELANLEVLNLDHNPISGSIPPEIGKLGKLRWLRLDYNRLRGGLPPELGNLEMLEYLRVDRNFTLSGPIPPELGNLGNLKFFDADHNQLAGPIPPELGSLAALEVLLLRWNKLTGALPAELAGLASLRRLQLDRNQLTGSVPAFLGELPHLWDLQFGGNEFSGPLPGALGNLAGLEHLSGYSNKLDGPIPASFGNLSKLRSLNLLDNPGLSGRLPAQLTRLRSLEQLRLDGTGVCAPSEADYLEWLQRHPTFRVPVCEASAPPAYLLQTVQSREYPVPLVAGEPALLRVFVTASRATDERLPAVRASFYNAGGLVYVAEIPAAPVPIPTEVDEGSRERTPEALIPGWVIQPGLEMVAEVAPGAALDPGLQVVRRIPAMGRMTIEVHEMPLWDLTVVPWLNIARPDSSVIGQSLGMAADPHGHELLFGSRVMMPVADIEVTAREPVFTTTNEIGPLLHETVALQIIESDDDREMWLGMMAGAHGGILGIALWGGRTLAAIPNSGVIAHEAGHGWSLGHAPCGPVGDDPDYPYPGGFLGGWGYNVEADELMSPHRFDVMSYCDPIWISDFYYTKAFRWRLRSQWDVAGGSAAMSEQPEPSLLLWGGVDANGAPFIEPALAVDAPAKLPESPGEHRLVGRSQRGVELFSLDFAMPATAHPEAGSYFAFALPVRESWKENLASITLTGPGGSAAVDRHGDRAVVVLRDPTTGKVRGLLRDVEPDEVARAIARLTESLGLEVLTSRGVPEPEQWER